MRLESDAFDDGSRVPQVFTCAGKDLSPELQIDNVPDEAETLALIVEDPDAPRGRFVHWLLWNIPADRREIPEGLPQQERVNELDGAAQGRNGFGEIGYRGPCPPSGAPHHYRFQLFALNTKLDVEPGADRDTLQQAMEGHVVDTAELTGLYGR